MSLNGNPRMVTTWIKKGDMNTSKNKISTFSRPENNSMSQRKKKAREKK
jgi:hypothetical protein